MAHTNSSAVPQQWTGNPSELSEVQALRQELADAKKKLEGYADAGLDESMFIDKKPSITLQHSYFYV
jgi:hypothetical protein